MTVMSTTRTLDRAARRCRCGVRYLPMAGFLLVGLMASADRLHAQRIAADVVDLRGVMAWDGTTGSYIGTSSPAPLSIVHRAMVPQPIRMYGGPGGSLLMLDIASTGEVQVPRGLGLGPGVAPGVGERLRIGRIANTGTGLIIDMTATDSATALAVRNVGASGTVHAGIAITAVANGSGTGLRFGGPSGSGRATLGTAIDVTGGTGYRYNALVAGAGTALDIGATTPPVRGIDVTAAGSDHIGGVFRANMLGTGVVGIARSGSWTDPPVEPRVGVRGHAASNSTVASDIIVGVLGTTVRGGSGGTNTTSIGVDARADGQGTNHGGLSVGLRAAATSTDAGTAAAIGVLADVEPSTSHLAIVARRGDVYLGSSTADRPGGVPLALSQALPTANTSTTYLHTARISGDLVLRHTTSPPTVVQASPQADTIVYRLPTTAPDPGAVLAAATVAGDTVDLAWTLPASTATLTVAEPTVLTADAAVYRIVTIDDGALRGVRTPGRSRILTIAAVQGSLPVRHEDIDVDPADRIRLPGGTDRTIVEDGMLSLWYDATSARWRMLSQVP